MNTQEKQAARDRIAALKMRWEQARGLKARYASYLTGLEEAAARDKYVLNLEALCDELTVPEPEDLTRDLERSLVKVSVERACGVKRNVRVAR